MFVEANGKRKGKKQAGYFSEKFYRFVYYVLILTLSYPTYIFTLIFTRTAIFVSFPVLERIKP